MNVEFRCPNCKSRLFAEPAGGVGAKHRRLCQSCGQARYEQVEEWQGDARYNFVDEKRQTHHTDPDAAAMANMNEKEKKEFMRTRVLELTGKSVDRRWGYDRVQEAYFKAMDEVKPLPEVDTSMKEGVAP